VTACTSHSHMAAATKVNLASIVLHKEAAQHAHHTSREELHSAQINVPAWLQLMPSIGYWHLQAVGARAMHLVHLVQCMGLQLTCVMLASLFK